MIKNKPLLIRDSREKPTHGYDWGETDIFSGTKIDTIKYGDYSIDGYEEIIFIERKCSVAEIAKNITEKRFTNLLNRAIKRKYKFLICEFSFSDICTYPIGSDIPKRLWKKIRVKPEFIQSSIVKIAVEYGVQVLFCDDKIKAEEVCYSILKKIYKLENK